MGGDKPLQTLGIPPLLATAKPGQCNMGPVAFSGQDNPGAMCRAAQFPVQIGQRLAICNAGKQDLGCIAPKAPKPVETQIKRLNLYDLSAWCNCSS